MKKLIRKLMLMLTLLLVVFIGICILSSSNKFGYLLAILSDSVDYIGNGSGEVLPRMEHIRQQEGTTKLIIGDSVANQIFEYLDDSNEDYCIATSNRAITVAGQYIFAEQFLQNHSDVTDIYLILIPETLKTEIDTTYGYQYVVIPFTETDTLEVLDKSTQIYMKKLYGSFFMQPWVIRGIGSSGLNRKLYINLINSKVYGQYAKYVEKEYQQYKLLSNTAINYLHKLKELCDKEEISLHLISGPLEDSDERRQEVIELEKEYRESGLEQLFPEYLDSIIYYPVEQFTDGIHFSEEFETHEYLNQVIRDMQRVTDSMEDLKLYNENINGE